MGRCFEAAGSNLLFLVLSLAACERSSALHAERTDEIAERRDAAALLTASKTEPAMPGSAAPAASAPSSAPPHAGECAPLAATPKVEVHTFKLSSKYHAQIKYPALVSSSPAVDKELATRIETDLKRRQREFTKNADEAIAAGKDDPDGLKPDQAGQEIDCQQTFLSATLLSLACSSIPSLGGAYPDVEHFAYNFQFCADGKVRPLHLADICRPGPACIQLIARLVNQSLQSGPAKEADIHIDPKSEALQKFAITPKGLRIFANEELPHALDEAGTIDVSFGKLRVVLKTDGALAALLAPP